MKLTEPQINFILDVFFKSYSDKYAGAMGIARKLITDGTVIVAGNDSIFKGGIGNFIKTHKADGLFDCLEYKIDLESLVSSHFFRESLECAITDLKKESAILIEKTSNLEKLYNGKTD